MIDRNSHDPLYIQVKNHIVSEIESGRIRIGDKLMSEPEMQKFYGVARPTIRAALSELVMDGCLRKEHGLGTFCVAYPKKGKTINVDVIVDQKNTYFTPYLLSGISRVFEVNNCTLRLHSVPATMTEAAALLHKIMSHDTDGVILQHIPPCPEGQDAFDFAMQQYQAARIPVIILLGSTPSKRCSDTQLLTSITIDEEYGAKVSARYLLDCGHRRIAALSSPDYALSSVEKRLSGFRSAVNQVSDAEPYEWTVPANGPESLLPLLREKQITAVQCYNDELAIAFLQMLVKNGIRVPQDISLVGFDDTDLSRSCMPQLTTVTHPKDQLGIEAANLMLRWIRHSPEPQEDVIYRPGLVIRQSVRTL